MERFSQITVEPEPELLCKLLCPQPVFKSKNRIWIDGCVLYTVANYGFGKIPKKYCQLKTKCRRLPDKICIYLPEGRVCDFSALACFIGVRVLSVSRSNCVFSDNDDLWSRLVILELVDTGLKELPPKILESTSICNLNLSGSNLSLQSCIDFSKMCGLQQIFLSRCMLRLIPKFPQEGKLMTIDLSINLLTSPVFGWTTKDEACFPNNLVSLHLNDNYFTHFPLIPSSVKFVYLSNNPATNKH